MNICFFWSTFSDRTYLRKTGGSNMKCIRKVLLFSLCISMIGLPIRAEETRDKQRQTLQAEIYTDASYTKRMQTADSITLQGDFEKGTQVYAYPTDVDLPGAKTKAAYDITIMDPDKEPVEPDQPVTVQIHTEKKLNTDVTSVYHVTGSIDEITARSAAHQVTFSADSFSVYAIGEKYARSMVFQMDGESWYHEILTEGEIPTRPATPTKADCHFKGWKNTKTGQLIDETFWNTPTENLTQDEEILFEPVFEKIFHVAYKGDAQASAGIFHTQEYAAGGQLNTAAVPFTPAEGFSLVGWSTKPNAQTPDVQDGMTVTQDLVLYPVLQSGQWITFDVNGGESMNPCFVPSGEKPSQCMKEDPKRTGYTFAGWYTDPSLQHAWTAADQPLTKALKLYAKWIPDDATYQIIYMKQNTSGTGYDYDRSVTRTAKTGTKLTVAAGDPYVLKEDGKTVCSLNQTKTAYFHYVPISVGSQSVKGDGTTVVYVYLDRNVYHITFHLESMAIVKNGITYTSASPYTLTARYGEEIKDRWPAGDDIKNLDGTNTKWVGWNNVNQKSYYSSERRCTLESDMIPNDLANQNDARFTVEGRTSTTSYDVNITYMEGTKEAPIGVINQFVGKSRYKGGYWRPNELAGFTINGGSNSQKTYVKAGESVTFYFTRNIYTVDCYNAAGTKVERSVQVPYDKLVKNYLPSDLKAPNKGYQFGGWYTTPTFEEASRWNDNNKMPAANIRLYPKWIAPVHTVQFDLNGGHAPDDQADYTAQLVVDKQQAVRPADPVREDSRFIGWYQENGSPFHFSAPITASITLQAKWIPLHSTHVHYDSNGGSKASWTSAKAYTVGAQAEAEEMRSDCHPPEGKNRFLYWNTKKDGSGASYYAHDLFTVDQEDMTLYAIWADQRHAQLTFDANGGTYPDQKATRTVQFSDADGHTGSIPNDEFTITSTYVPTRPGYRFIGWTKIRSGDGTEYRVGDKVRVSGDAVLYAQWQKLHTLTIVNQVEGTYDDDSLFHFDVTLTDAQGKPLSGTWQGKTADKNGTVSFSLKKDQSFCFDELPDQADYRIEETGPQGYQTTVEGDPEAGTLKEKDDFKVIYRHRFQVVETGIRKNIHGLLMCVGLLLCGLWYRRKFIR